MLAYLDASVLLRRIFRELGALPGFRELGPFIASTVLEVECFRTLHRARLSGRITEDEGVRKSEEIYRHLLSIDQIRVTDAVIQAARRPFAVALPSLDAIHLASALLWRERRGGAVAFLTHDTRLGSAARAEGFRVHGV